MSADAKRTARDIIADRFHQRGYDQAYRAADRLIMDLYHAGFDIVARDHLAGLMEELERQAITIDTQRIRAAGVLKGGDNG